MSCDLIMTAETLLNGEAIDGEIALSGMSAIRNDRHSKGGGVLLYYRNELLLERIESTDHQVAYTCWCRLQLKRGDISWWVSCIDPRHPPRKWTID